MRGRTRSRTAQLAGLATILTLAATSAAVAAPGGQTTTPAGVQSQRIDSRLHRALLDLYSLDTRLQAAQAHLASLQTAAANLRRARAELRQELGAAHATFKVSQRQLALRLRLLYEQGGVDPLAVVLGASSLGKGLRNLDDLTRIAEENRQVVAVTRSAHRRLVHARRTLALDARRLSRSLVAARAAAQRLASTVAARSSYIASLRAEQLRATQVQTVVTTAQTVAQRSQPLQTPTAPTGGRRMVVSATCYDLPGRTATGMPVGWGVVAVDPSVIPLGTKLYVPGYGKGVAADVGGGIKGAIIDLWMPYSQCMAWGRRTVTITIY